MEERPASLLGNYHAIIIKSDFNFFVPFYTHFIGGVTVLFGHG